MLTVDPINAGALIKHCLNIDTPIMLWGDTGVGKTDLTNQVGQADDYTVLSYMLLLRDQVDLRGAPVPELETKTTTWYQPDDLPFVGSRRFDATKKYLLFLDEINTAPPSLQAVAFGLVLERRAGPHVLQPSVRIVAAGNRQSDRGAAQRMPRPLENRFMHLTVVPSVQAWARHAAKVGTDPVLIAFMMFRERDGYLHDVSKDEPTHATPRSWMTVAKHLSLAPPLRQLAVAATVGEAKAAELEAFIQLYSSLPPIKTIIANPDKAPTPDDVARSDKERLGLRYAVAVALGKAATRQTFQACLTYAARLPREISIVMVVDAINRDKGLMETPAFVKWALANQDVTL